MSRHKFLILPNLSPFSGGVYSPSYPTLYTQREVIEQPQDHQAQLDWNVIFTTHIGLNWRRREMKESHLSKIEQCKIFRSTRWAFSVFPYLDLKLITFKSLLIHIY